MSSALNFVTSKVRKTPEAASTWFCVCRLFLALLAIMGSSEAVAAPEPGNWSGHIPVTVTGANATAIEVDRVPIPADAMRVEVEYDSSEQGTDIGTRMEDSLSFYIDSAHMDTQSCADTGKLSIPFAKGAKNFILKARVCGIETRTLPSTFKYKYLFLDNSGNPVFSSTGGEQGHCDPPDCYTLFDYIILGLVEGGEGAGHLLQNVWHHLEGVVKKLFGGRGNTEFVDMYADPGNVPVLRLPTWGLQRRSSAWIDAPVYPLEQRSTLEFEVRCTARASCGDYLWHLQRYEDGSGFVPVTEDGQGNFPGWNNGTFLSNDAWRRLEGFRWDGALYRVKVWQSNDGRPVPRWTVEHEDWKYFYNGVPQVAPSVPQIISPKGGDNNRGNWVFFQVQNRMEEMMHPNFKYQIEVYKAGPNGELPSTILENENHWLFDGVSAQPRGNAPAVGYNLEPFILPNLSAGYLWRVKATFAEQGELDPFNENSGQVSSSEFRAFTTTELPYSGGSRLSRFGQTVDIDDTVAVVGGPYTIHATNPVGEAVIFERTDDVWKRKALLKGPLTNGLFGSDVCLKGRTLIVGAKGTATVRGKAYVYERGTTDWTLKQTLVPSAQETAGAEFGHAVASDGSTLAIGAPHGNGDKGHVYVFTNVQGTWTAQGVVFAKNSAGTADGIAGDQFGAAVGISGGSLLIGAPGRSGQDGLIYVYTRQGTSWVPGARINPLSTGKSARFGYTLDLEANQFLTSAPGPIPGNISNLFDGSPEALLRSGQKGLTDSAVYVFKFAGPHWQLVQELEALSPEAGSLFGHSVARAEDLLLVGAPYSSAEGFPGTRRGSATVFTKSTDELLPWNATNTLTDVGVNGANHASDGAEFGYSIALSGVSAIIGAPLDSHQYEELVPLKDEHRFLLKNTGFDGPGDAEFWRCSPGTGPSDCGSRVLSTGGASTAHQNVFLPVDPDLFELVDANALSVRFGGKAVKTTGAIQDGAFALNFYDGSVAQSEDCHQSSVGTLVGRSLQNRFKTLPAGACTNVEPIEVPLPAGTRVIQFRLETIPLGADYHADDLVMEILQTDRRGTITFTDIDIAPPVATIVAPDSPVLTNRDSITFSVVFSEAVQNVDAGNFVITKDAGVVHNTPVITTENDSRIWTARLDGINGNGVLSLTVQAQSETTSSTIQDLNGNALAASVVGSVVIDNTPAALQNFSVSPPKAAVGEKVQIGFTLSEYVDVHPTVTINGHAAEIYFLENGSQKQAGGQDIQYVYEYTVLSSDPLAPANVLVSVADMGGNAQQISKTGLSITKSPPTVVLSTGAPNPVKSTAINVVATFNEPVTGFVVGDLLLTNATASSFSGSGANYTFKLHPIAQGAFKVQVPADKALATSGRLNLPSNAMIRTFDSIAPAVIVSTTAASPTKTKPIPVTVKFSESVIGFGPDDVALTNATLGNFAGAGTTYTFNMSAVGQGAMKALVGAGAVQDAATNPNPASNTLSVVYDTTKPVPTLTSTAATPTKNSPIPVKVVFSESVTGFTAADVSVTRATLSNFAGSGSTFTFNLVPTGQGAVLASVGTNKSIDHVGIGNAASNVLSRTYDTVAPSVVITTPGATTVKSPFAVKVVFSENITGFVSSDVSVLNGIVTEFKGSGTTYTFRAKPTTAGQVVVSVGAGKAMDAAGNTNLASNLLKVTYEFTVTVTWPNGGETLEAGSTRAFTWTSTTTAPEVRLRLFRGDTAVYYLGGLHPNNGKAYFTLPPSLAPGADYRLRCYTPDNKCHDFSDANFTVAKGSGFLLQAPNGGEVLPQGALTTATWKNPLDKTLYPSVKFQLFRGNDLVRVLGGLRPNSEQWIWRIPTDLLPGAGYRLLMHTPDFRYQDFSNATFSIAAPAGDAVQSPETADGGLATSKDIAGVLAEAFSALDANRDNQLSLPEARLAFPDLSEADMAEFDSDENGTVSLAELEGVETAVEVCESSVECAGLLRAQFHAANADNNSGLSSMEARSILPGLTETQFAELDRNGDGLLGYEELGGQQRNALQTLLLTLLGLPILAWQRLRTLLWGMMAG